MPLLLFAGVACVSQVIFGRLMHLYRGRYRVGSFEEVAAVFWTVVATEIVLVIIEVAVQDRKDIPLSIPALAALITFVLIVGSRYAWRLSRERRRLPSLAGEPILIFGAGEGGAQVISAMLRDPRSTFFPVGLLDDDPQKRNLRIRGIRVLGGRDGLLTASKTTRAKTVILAIPSAKADLIRELSDLAVSAGLVVKVLPTVEQLLGPTVALDDIRDIDVSDLLGRRQIQLDMNQITSYIAGRRILVTGAGGSIGSELCRQLALLGPAELIMLDRDESALHAVQLSIKGRALLDSDELVLADIRDVVHLGEVFESRRPEVVFHAAALKHLTLLERHPGEAVKSNVWGTLSVLNAARAAGVTCFVNISTDKAANPLSVLGFSKRITERLTAHFAMETSLLFLSVRFGNVLGSRGSVLTAFATQLAAGGPLTVTHADVTRYFMTVREAVQLVLQAGAIGRPGEVLVLDMGEPVRIADLARRLATTSRVAVEFTGLRPGEKLHEDLLGVGESALRSSHELIAHVDAPPLDPVHALALDPWGDAGLLRQDLKRLAQAQLEQCDSFDSP